MTEEHAADTTDVTGYEPDDSGNVTITCAAKELGRALYNVSLFASKDRTRPVLTGVNITINADDDLGTTLTIEATDSYTLVEETLPVARSSGIPKRTYLLIASELAPIIKQLRAGYDATVTFNYVPDSTNPVSVVFLIDGRTFSVSTCDTGEYPNTKQLYPDVETEWSLTDGVIGLDPARVGTFGKVIAPGAKRPPTGPNSGMMFRFNGPLKPVSIEFASWAGFRGLIMPTRHDR